MQEHLFSNLADTATGTCKPSKKDDVIESVVDKQRKQIGCHYVKGNKRFSRLEVAKNIGVSEETLLDFEKAYSEGSLPEDVLEKLTTSASGTVSVPLPNSLSDSSEVANPELPPKREVSLLSEDTDYMVYLNDYVKKELRTKFLGLRLPSDKTHYLRRAGTATISDKYAELKLLIKENSVNNHASLDTVTILKKSKDPNHDDAYDVYQLMLGSDSWDELKKAEQVFVQRTVKQTTSFLPLKYNQTDGSSTKK
jgi:hypothetical protein